jgi:hypothetical protein
MTRALRAVLVSLAVAAGLLAAPSTASAAPVSTAGQQTRVGYDVSYPQCSTTLPSARAFGIVGVNGGLSTKANPCLSNQLTWASRANGSVPTQPRAQVYLNTANPGELIDLISTWPTDGATPYGECDGENTTACSWQYGWERARNSVVSFFTPAARAARLTSLPSSYTWWLDVETMNSWQSGGQEALDRNRATLEGMTAYLLSRGGTVGIYSTGLQFGQIVGTVPLGSNLIGRDSWLAGATTLTGAQANCRLDPLVPGGRVVLAQYVENDLDHNHSCA